jgi:hypothetical protein
MLETGVGILEFGDNEFMQSVARGLADLRPRFLRVGQLRHPSPPPCSLIVDRVSFCDAFLRSVVRYWATSGATIINSPFFTSSFDKLSEMVLYDKLGIAHPRTILLPRLNRQEDVRELVAEIDWQAIEAQIGFPCILKPVDGYAWQDVFRVESPTALRALYETLRDSRTLIVQELVSYVRYFRAFCLHARDVLIVRWTPLPFDRGEYETADPAMPGGLVRTITEKTAVLNAELGLDFNTVEWCVTADGTPVVIDSNNDVPDVRREKLPAACYDWIVERFCQLVRERLAEIPLQTNPQPG